MIIMGKAIYVDNTKIRKIYVDNTKIKKVYIDNVLVWTASETVNGIGSVTYNLTASSNPSVVYPVGHGLAVLVDGNTERQCTWNNNNQYVDFDITDSRIEPTSITVWSGVDNNAGNGVKVRITGFNASGVEYQLWDWRTIASNSSSTFTRNSNESEFKKIRFYLEKNGSTNLTISEIAFNTLVKYPL